MRIYVLKVYKLTYTILCTQHNIDSSCFSLKYYEKSSEIFRDITISLFWNKLLRNDAPS